MNALEGDSASSRERTDAAHQLIRREVNEQIKLLHDRFRRTDALDLFCECGRGSCSARFRVPIPEYERVRRHPSRFLVVEGHAAREAEVVAAEEGVLVVEARPDRTKLNL
jgi:hypothetical protein